MNTEDQPIKKERILIVDDADFCRKIIGAALIVIGYEIDTAKNGRDAVKIIKETAHKLDLIILDLIMPGISGMEVLRIVQPEIKKYNLPVLILTGVTQERDEIIKLRNLGVSGYLKKSDPPDYFIEKVRSVLQKDKE